MDRVRDLVLAGGVSVVLAQDRDRFTREPAYHYLLRREFAKDPARDHGSPRSMHLRRYALPRACCLTLPN